MFFNFNYSKDTVNNQDLKFWLLILVVFILSCSTDHQSSESKSELRSHFRNLSITEVKMMIIEKGLFDKYWNKSGNFENHFELQEIKNDKVIVDHASGLIWHQSGSEDFLNLTEASEWLNNLNRNNYAEINTWRLPTLEEALSLMENQKMNGNFYIDPVFDTWQWCILTGDSLGLTKSWLVAFSGRVDWFDSTVRINYVRPVSSF